jgi:hypothetical protein
LTAELAEMQGLAKKVKDSRQSANLDWLVANFEFTLLLDEVGEKLTVAYLLKDAWLTGQIKEGALPEAVAAARKALKAAPVEKLFRVYARRVRSKGELGELSALNQKLWLVYRELDRFLAELEGKGTGK